MEDFNRNISKLQAFNLRFYLNKPNRMGLGVIYASYRIDGSLFRISTNLRTKKEYWDKLSGDIILKRDTMSRADWKIHNMVSHELNSIYNDVKLKIEYYICDCTKEIATDIMGHEIAKIIHDNSRMKKNKDIEQISLLSRLVGIVLDYDNDKSRRTFLGILSTFKRFVTEKGIRDDIHSMNMITLREWRDWLDKEEYSVNRIKSCVNLLFTLAGKMERKYAYNFKLDRSKIEPVKDKRTQEERRNNGIALTEEEIKKMSDIDLSENVELITARDMFLLQCWCGCRVEDLQLLLNSRHISLDQDIYYSTFTTQKKGITSIIPLNALYPDALEIVEKYRDNCPYKTQKDMCKYNYYLRKLARLAGLDREIIYTGQRGGNKYTETNKLHDIISSHDGRHTFITNCIRYKGLSPDKIKIISGHSDTKIIESVYINLTHDNNKAILRKAIREAQVKQSITSP